MSLKDISIQCISIGMQFPHDNYINSNIYRSLCWGHGVTLVLRPESPALLEADECVHSWLPHCWPPPWGLCGRTGKTKTHTVYGMYPLQLIYITDRWYLLCHCCGLIFRVKKKQTKTISFANVSTKHWNKRTLTSRYTHLQHTNMKHNIYHLKITIPLFTQIIWVRNDGPIPATWRWPVHTASHRGHWWAVHPARWDGRSPDAHSRPSSF